MIDLPVMDPYVEINLATTGISKGLEQTSGPQLRIVSGASVGDFSIEAYGKNVEPSGDQGVEFGTSVAIEREAAGLELSASLRIKTVSGIATADRTALEVEAEAKRSFGPIGASASATYSPNETGSTRQSVFLEAGLAVKIAEEIEIVGALGRRERDGPPDYTSFKVGVAYEPIANVTLDVRYYGTNQADEGDPFRPGFVAALRARF